MELAQKVVVITGASSGLGKALAETLSKEGAKVVVSSKASPELEAVAKEIGGEAIPSDVSNEEDVKKLAQKVEDEFGRIDIWINNAGIWTPHGTLETMDTARARELMGVNYFGVLFGSREAMIRMRAQNSGIILNVLSIRALDPRANEATYTASKFAADGLTKCLRMELRGTNVEVIAVYPGGIQTDLFLERLPQEYQFYMKPREVAERIVSNLKKKVPDTELVIRRG